MKKCAVIATIALLLILSACRGESIRVYETDHMETYRATINAMFGDTWTLLSTEDRFEPNQGYICSCGFDGRAQQFIEWTIEYQDGRGELRQFVFDNRIGLASQVARYVQFYIGAYYKENFVDVHMADVPLGRPVSVFGFIMRANANRGREENREWVQAADAYRNQLGSPEGTIRLSELTPENAFEKIPMSLSIHVSLDGEDGWGPPFEEDIMSKMEAMIEEMNAFSNNQLTASITLSAGFRSYSWFYIRGERVFGISSMMYFDRYIFESFIGVFW